MSSDTRINGIVLEAILLERKPSVVFEDIPCPVVIAGEAREASETKTLGVGDDAGLEHIGVGECA